MPKVKWVKNSYCSLEMKENFGMRPLAAASQWIFIVDSGWALDGCCYFLVSPLAGGVWGAVAGPLEGQLQMTCQSVLHLNHLQITCRSLANRSAC